MAPQGDGAVVSLYCGVGERGRGVTEGGCRRLKQPKGITLDKEGSLFVADYGNHCVYRFFGTLKSGIGPRSKVVAGEEGHMLGDYDPLRDIESTGPIPAPDGEGCLLKRPIDVKCHPGGNGIFVLDSESNVVQQYAPGQAMSALVVGERKGSVNTPEGLKYPRVVCPCEDGSVILSDAFSHRVRRCRLQAPGELPEKAVDVLAGSSNSTHQRSDCLSFPTGVVVLPDGSLLVADTNHHRIQKFPPGSGEKAEGITIAGSKDCTSGSSLSQLNMPTCLAVDARDGSLLVTDRDNARVLRFPSGCKAGDCGEVIIGPEHLKKPWGVCVAEDGTVFVSDERRGVVLRYGAPQEGQQRAAVAEDDDAVVIEEVAGENSKAPEAEKAEMEPEIEDVLDRSVNLAPSVSGSAMDLD
eukprot:TRINITY_DN112852_c0_g1_i1.p1 TRINITY_DN112852_c0_g1~~TRINITY_DN112852_c0_g1_i1.p1  ORF type:complete len:432 (-),score=93.78 TRINITY_DN112852_c0_g1_i1:231-1460(-)